MPKRVLFEVGDNNFVAGFGTVGFTFLWTILFLSVAHCLFVGLLFVCVRIVLLSGESPRRGYFVDERAEF